MESGILTLHCRSAAAVRFCMQSAHHAKTTSFTSQPLLQRSCAFLVQHPRHALQIEYARKSTKQGVIDRCRLGRALPINGCRQGRQTRSVACRGSLMQNAIISKNAEPSMAPAGTSPLEVAQNWSGRGEVHTDGGLGISAAEQSYNAVDDALGSDDQARREGSEVGTADLPQELSGEGEQGTGKGFGGEVEERKPLGGDAKLSNRKGSDNERNSSDDEPLGEMHAETTAQTFARMEDLISERDVLGGDHEAFILEAIGRDKIHFLAPQGKRRHLPLFVYLPGLDGTGLFCRQQLPALLAQYDVRCLVIPSADTWGFQELADAAAELIRHERVARQGLAESIEGSSDTVQIPMPSFETQRMTAAAPSDADGCLEGMQTQPTAASQETHSSSTDTGPTLPKPLTELPLTPSLTPPYPVTVYGESFGSGIALQLASSYPDEVHSLIVLNSITAFRRQPLLQFGSMFMGSVPAGLHDLGSYVLAPMLADWRRLAEESQFLLVPPFSTRVLTPDAVTRRSQMMLNFEPSEPELGQIKASTLLLASGQDRLMPSVQEADWLASRIPNCRVKVLPDSGHVALLEKGICLASLLQEAGFIDPRNPGDTTWKQNALTGEESWLAELNDSPPTSGARCATDSTGQAGSSDAEASVVNETAESGSQPSTSVVESGRSGDVVGDRQAENSRAGESGSADFASALKQDKVSANREAEDSESSGPTLGENLADQLRTVTQRLSDGLSEQPDDERAPSNIWTNDLDGRRGDSDGQGVGSDGQRADTDSGFGQKESPREVSKQGKATLPSSAEPEQSMTSSSRPWETEPSPPAKKKRTIPIEEMNRRRRSRKAKKDSGASSFLKEDLRWLQGLGGGVFANLGGFLGLRAPEVVAPLASEKFGGLDSGGGAAERERAEVEVCKVKGGANDGATEVGERGAMGVGSEVKAGIGVLGFLDKLSGNDINIAGESLGGASAIGVESTSVVGGLNSFGFATDVDSVRVTNNASGSESSGTDFGRSRPVSSGAVTADLKGSLDSSSARLAGMRTEEEVGVDKTTPTASFAKRSRLDLGIVSQGEGSDVIEASNGAPGDVIRAGNGAVANGAMRQGGLKVEGAPEVPTSPTQNGNGASENRTGSSQNGSAGSRANQSSSSSVESVRSMQAEQISSNGSKSSVRSSLEETGRIALDERSSGEAEANVSLPNPTENGSQVGEDSGGVVKGPVDAGLPAVSVKKGPEELKMVGLAAGQAFDTMLSDMPQYRLWNWLTRPEFYGLDNVPVDAAPLLFVGNHTLFGIYDMPLMMYELRKRRGLVLRGLAHEWHWRSPLGDIFEKYGAVRATPRNCFNLLKAGEPVLLYPGGGREVAKRKGEKYKLLWKDDTDFVRLAMKCKATIVPFATVGVEDAFDILMGPDEIMASPLGDLIRPTLEANGFTEDVIPSLATGGNLLPRPERLYFHFGEPIHTSHYTRKDLKDKEECARLYKQTKTAVQDGILLLQAKRSKDPLRELFPRAMVNIVEGWDGS